MLLLMCACVNESNAGPERLFSRVTKETHGRRSQLACATVDAIFRIQEQGAKVRDVTVDLRTQIYQHFSADVMHNLPERYLMDWEQQLIKILSTVKQAMK